ncbi:tRNA (adenosine(37)-N6)-threonylcarbamoyltransferase complex dimerization subunit type 1 TsaB [bacterium]|nr:tRNA (adenosine(37)-N6)-threonylcarbamoyltransferase complex dimerization subunit type 1 TsaB [bacterium]
MLLAFDTCLDKTYVGLADNDKILDTVIVENDGNTYHSAFLISNIRDLLKNNNLTPKDLTTVVTDIGPGSFTGIRACMTVAKVMAQQLNLKTIGISSLEIISRVTKTEKTPLVLLDARKNKAYAWDKEILGAIPVEDLKEKVINGNYSLITDDSMYEIFSPLNSDIVSYTKTEHDFAKILIDISRQKKAEDFYALKPLYIQPPPVFGK